MFLSIDKPSPGQSGEAAAAPWLFLRRLEEALQDHRQPETLIGTVLSVCTESLGIAAGWAGIAAPGGWSVLAGSPDLANRFAGCGAGAWLPEDPAGLVGNAWRTGASGLAGAVAVILLRGRARPRGVLVLAAVGGETFPVNWSTDMLDHFGMLIGHALEALEKQTALQRGQVLYETLLRGADIMMQARSEQVMLRRLCAELLASGIFVSCRIGGFDQDGKYAWMILRALGGTRRLRAMIARGARSYGGDGKVFESVSATAWRTERSVFADDYENDPLYAPWNGLAGILGWRSMAALPVFRGGRRWAVLSVDAGLPDVFDDDLRTLLERLAGMVGHALDELDLKRALGAKRASQSKIARRDPLTGLPNRLALQDYLRLVLRETRRRRGMLGIGVLDLDEFKRINDIFGHAAGDAVLREAASRLRKALRDVDFVARLGGDEFALVLTDWNESHAPGFCARMREAIGGDIILPDGQCVSISFSAGFTLFPHDDAEPDTLLRHADAALYAAKAARGTGGPAWSFYQDVNHGPASGAAHMRGLLRSGALVVHYQPMIDIQTGTVRAAEALARLNDGGTLLPPGKFLPEMRLAERNDLFLQVLAAGLRQMGEWDAQGHPMSLSVNVDSQILLLDGTMAHLDEALRRSGIAPQRLVLEIVETHEFLDLQKAHAQLSAVRERGVRIALDDLGIGYSSILKLRDLPIDVVKLDRAFIAELRHRPDNLAFISAFQMLTRTLGMMLVVEGVETDDILDALRMMGDGLAQGFGIARPMPGDQLSAWMRKYAPASASGVPTTLLGAYAVHLNWVRVFQVDRVRGDIPNYLRVNNPFSLERFFASASAHDEPAAAHRDLQELLRRDSGNRAAIDAAAARFRETLVARLAAEA